jgi:hypothetical protein
MTDKEYNKTVSRIRALIKKWYAPGGWSYWRTDFNYSRERHPETQGVAAETHADFKYSHATITFYFPVVCGMSDEELEATFVHELCHLTASTYPNFEDNPDAVARFERTVDDFSRHIIWCVENVKALDKQTPT